MNIIDDDDDVNWAEATSWLGLTHISRRKRESDILVSDLVEWNTLKLSQNEKSQISSLYGFCLKMDQDGLCPKSTGWLHISHEELP